MLTIAIDTLLNKILNKELLHFYLIYLHMLLVLSGISFSFVAALIARNYKKEAL